MPFGAQELIIILIIVLVLFGAKRLPEMGQGLGKAIRSFKDAVSSDDKNAEVSTTPGEKK